MAPVSAPVVAEEEETDARSWKLAGCWNLRLLCVSLRMNTRNPATVSPRLQIFIFAQTCRFKTLVTGGAGKLTQAASTSCQHRSQRAAERNERRCEVFLKKMCIMKSLLVSWECSIIWLELFVAAAAPCDYLCECLPC